MRKGLAEAKGEGCLGERGRGVFERSRSALLVLRRKEEPEMTKFSIIRLSLMPKADLGLGEAGRKKMGLFLRLKQGLFSLF